MPMQSLIKVDVDSKDRLIRLLSSAEIQIQNDFLQAIKNVKEQSRIDEITRLLEQGSIDQALALTASIPLVLANAVNSNVVTTGNSTARVISDVSSVIITFDQTNDRAVSLMRQNRLRLIREFTSSQRELISSALIRGLQQGSNPRAIARDFRNSIGLTSRQNASVDNYRRLLENNSSQALTRTLRDRRSDRSIRRSIDLDEPLSTSRINSMVNRYRQRFITHRSEVIARTEALSVVNEANEIMYEQAFDEGVLDAGTITKEWITAGDSRVRESHNGMDGQIRNEGEDFISDAGNSLRFPGDRNAPGSEIIQCRCVVSRRIN